MSFQAGSCSWPANRCLLLEEDFSSLCDPLHRAAGVYDTTSPRVGNSREHQVEARMHFMTQPQMSQVVLFLISCL